MRRSAIKLPFTLLMTAMNVAGTISLAGALGCPLEAQRQGTSMLAALSLGLTAWIWPVGLWASSVWASRWLLRSGRPDLAALTALLPMLSLLGTDLLARG